MSTASERVLFVDLSRAAAVLFMVQGHTLQVLLAPEHQAGAFFNAWLYLRGLTSCAFLTLSGFSFSVATDRHWDDYLAFTPRLRKRLTRFGIFLALGYAMRIPVRPLTELWHGSHAQWQAFSQIDILQLVAVTLVGLQALTLVLGSRRRLAAVTLAAAAAIVVATPLVWHANWASHVPLAAASFLSDKTGSLFPLFPWAGYLLFGAALGLWAVGRRGGSRNLGRPLLLLGLAMVAAGLALDRLPFTPFGPIDFWTTSPNLFLIKAGSVLILLAAAARLTRAMTALPRPVSALSCESLTVYLVHLCVLYGSIWNPGLAQLVGPRLGVAATAGWASLLVGGMSLLAWMWHECKQRSDLVAAAIRAGVATVLFYVIA